MLRRHCEVEGNQDEVVRCHLITEVQVSSVLGNRAETSGFYGAGMLSGSAESVEPVVFSHATQALDVRKGRREVKT